MILPVTFFQPGCVFQWRVILREDCWVRSFASIAAGHPFALTSSLLDSAILSNRILVSFSRYNSSLNEFLVSVLHTEMANLGYD